MDSESLETMAILNVENEYIQEATQSANQSNQEATQSANQSTQVTNKRKRSSVWKEFVPVGVEQDGKQRGHCIHCNKKLITESNHGTSALKRHLDGCPKRASKPREERQYDHKVDRQMVSEIIVYHDLPFRYVEYEKVRARDRYLNPNCEPICRQTAGNVVFRKYEIEKEKLKKVFADFKGRVCFTADLWTARSTMSGYICLTSHYIDATWTLKNKILAFIDMKPPHTGEELAKMIMGCLKEWGLEKKVFCMTLDNATSNDSMQRIIRNRLQMISGGGFLSDGKFFHVRCCAHILNLIVKEGLSLATNLLENIRDSVKFVKASDSRKDTFAVCAESVGIKSGAGLSLDVPTRWNSTYDMLARALKFRKAFVSLKEYDRNYKSLPSQDEWDLGEKICDLLKPFSVITTYFSGVKYPTANVYFLQVWKIECLLIKYTDCGDSRVEFMAKGMQSKFAKYWDEYSIILAMGAVLDPRLKLQIQYAYDKVDPSTSEEKICIVKQNLIDLYKEYHTKTQVSSTFTTTPTPTPDQLLNESPLEDDPNFELFELERSIIPDSYDTKSNIDMYLDEPRLDLRSFTDMEVLTYWKTNGQRFGDLASLARDILSIPITTVASESAFSIGGLVLNSYRNRLLPRNVQALLCTRNWLRGFSELRGDIEDDFDDEIEDTTTITSSSRT